MAANSLGCIDEGECFLCLSSGLHAYQLPRQPTEDWQDISYLWIKSSRYNGHMLCMFT